MILQQTAKTGALFLYPRLSPITVLHLRHLECFHETKRYIYEKDLISLYETKNFQSFLLNKISILSNENYESYQTLLPFFLLYCL